MHCLWRAPRPWGLGSSDLANKERSTGHDVSTIIQPQPTKCSVQAVHPGPACMTLSPGVCSQRTRTSHCS